jgi:aconitate hydratase
MPDGAVIIAAITSCTNTSNPRNVIAAALLARNAPPGPERKPWVKTSLAPGSKAVSCIWKKPACCRTWKLGFGIVGFACTTCNGMSGALDPAIQQEIIDRDLYTTAVLSGNRNFDGRIHPMPAGLSGSPPLVVAYAIAGTVRFDIENDVLGVVDGKEIRLKDIWPSDGDRRRGGAPSSPSSSAPYEPMFSLRKRCRTRRPLYDWRAVHLHPPPAVLGTEGVARWRLRALHAPLALWRQHHHRPPLAVQRHPGRLGRRRVPGEDGAAEEDFNSYATHRGDHLTAAARHLANPQLVNEMAVVTARCKRARWRASSRRAGGAHVGGDRDLSAAPQPLIIIAGADYGQGSAATGPPRACAWPGWRRSWPKASSASTAPT